MSATEDDMSGCHKSTFGYPQSSAEEGFSGPIPDSFLDVDHGDTSRGFDDIVCFLFGYSLGDSTVN